MSKTSSNRRRTRTRLRIRLLRWQRRIAPYRQVLGIVTTLIVLIGALAVCWHMLSEIDARLVRASLAQVPLYAVLGSLLAALGSYGALVLYEWSAARFAGVKLRWPLLMLGGSCATAVGNAIGLSMLSGGAVRCRLYFPQGLHAPDVARMSVFVSLALGVTLPPLAAVAALIHQDTAAQALHLPHWAVAAIGYAVIALYVIALVLLYRARQPECPAPDARMHKLGRSLWRLPSLRLSLFQLVITLADVTCAAAVLYLLLPNAPPFATFLLVYLLALAAGVLSHVPGGIGVFEAIILSAFSGQVGAAELTAALLLYRVIYVLLPLLLAFIALLINEARKIADRLSDGTVISLVAPMLALMLFAVGITELLSNVAPEATLFAGFVSRWAPAALLEVATLALSVLGLVSLVLARGLGRRMASAWRWSVLTLLVGGGCALIKGVDVVDLALIIPSLLALLVFRSAFYRDNALLSMPLSWRFVLACVGVVLVSAWLMLLSHRGTPLASALWWHADYDVLLSRAFQGVVISALLLFGITLWWLLRPVKPLLPASPKAVERALAIVGKSRQPEGMLLATGGKSLLFNKKKNAFIAYRQHHRYLVALCDPVGATACRAGLVWDFRDLGERRGLTPLIYLAHHEDLALYQQAGQIAVKVAQEHLVTLDATQRDAATEQALSSVWREGCEQGLSFALYAAGEAPLQALREVSDQWVTEQGINERRYSCGRFDAHYLQHFRIATVSHDGKVLAFASVMEAGGAPRVVIDLVRWLPGLCEHSLDWLLCAMMRSLALEGYAELSVATLPVAQISKGRAGGLARAVNEYVLSRGETLAREGRLAHFEALFAPSVRPRYLVLPVGIDPAQALDDIAELVSQPQ
ncbi:phosphatidylglycerol lysyltransferase domain-containing protein [Carnimonas bestiolae]|uniref:phosphatidylglycerol lysyltransferase domain-containing protein n=1 Tax=Carnimonas bestiolae TaxID=3402172 RepID=UPI003EDBDFD7